MSESPPATLNGAQLAEQLRNSFQALLRTLDLLEPAECDAGRMEGGWSPKALLAHVAFWDDVQCRRMQRALAGGAPAFVSLVAGNDERAADDDARTMDEVMASAEDARERLAAFAESLSAAELQSTPSEGERTLLPAVLLQHMVEHTHRHRRDLWRYCGSMARWSRADLRALIDRQHTLVLESVAGLTEEQILSVTAGGDWSMRDLLVHIMAWSEYTVAALDGWPHPAPAAVGVYAAGPARDEDAVNADLMAARAGLNMIEIADGLATFHRRTLNRYDALDDEALASEGDYVWGEVGPLSALLFALTLHQAEHAEALWRARP